MHVIGKRIDAIIKEGMAPMLKKEGFKKKAGNFYREFENRIEIVNVQANKWNESSIGQFTINVGVYYPAIAEITEALPVKGMPKEYDCIIRERIGFLSPEKKDAWWNIDKTTNDLELSEEVTEQVKTLCLPWLAKMSDLNEVKTSVAHKNRAFPAAGIALYQGNREEALEYIKLALKQQPLAKSKINAWACKHGLM